MRIGVLVGSDQSQEWLLEWFYTHFRTNNPDCPIAFADFGMSPAAKNWCQQRGILFAAASLAPPIEKRIDFYHNEDHWGLIQATPIVLAPQDLVCYRKPFALAHSPFQRTLWLDLDCEVRGNLNALLSSPLTMAKLGAAQCGSLLFLKNLTKDLVFAIDKYNTGVILTEKDSCLVKRWISFNEGRFAFGSDEGSLSFLAEIDQMPITEISHRYNWPVCHWGENNEAIIYHWMGKEAKCRLSSMLSP